MAKTVPVSLETPALELFAAVGILADSEKVPDYLKLFATQTNEVLAKVRHMVDMGAVTLEKAFDFEQLLVDVAARIMCHPIVASNHYLQRFSQGVTLAQARHELQQFSVFALQFDVAQAKLMANAPTDEAYRERLNILLNEKGIPYKEGFEGELTGKWSYDTVHFTWLMKTAAGLGLKFEDLGKIWIGLPGTKKFVEATFSTYASIDQNTAAGASFGIENWAANFLWTPWIAGMKKLNATLPTPVHLGYLTYHESEERHHSQATLDELLENFLEPFFDSEKFFEGAEAILTNGVQPYYESQLASVPDKDETWPKTACSPRRFDPRALPRLALNAVTV